MLLNSLYMTLLPLLSTLSTALPLDGALNVPRIIPRAKSYSVINVDGGSSTPALPEATTVVEKTTKTQTIKVTDTAPTVTDTVTAIVEPTPAPATTSSPSKTVNTTSTSESSLQPSSSPAEQPSETPAPSIVTIIITETTGPTEYYDNGLWHTSYAVKTFEAAVEPTTTVLPSTVV